MLAGIVGQRHDDELVERAVQQRLELSNAFGIRAGALPHRQRPLIEPDEVAAFEMPRRGDRAGNRPSLASQFVLLRLGLSGARRLAHAGEDDPAVADDRRVAGVDRVERRLLPSAGSDTISQPAVETISINRSYSSSARDKSGGAEKFSCFHCDAIDGFADECLARMLDEHGGQRAVLGERPST